MGIQAPTFFLSIRPGSYTYIKLPINSVFTRILYNVYSIMWLFSLIYIYIHPMMCNRCTHLYILYITIILLHVCAYGVNGRKLWKDFFVNERHTLRKHEDCVSQCTRVHGPSIIIQRSWYPCGCVYMYQYILVLLLLWNIMEYQYGIIIIICTYVNIQLQLLASEVLCSHDTQLVWRALVSFSCDYVS